MLQIISYIKHVVKCIRGLFVYLSDIKNYFEGAAL